jgi:hypothetical protein
MASTSSPEPTDGSSEHPYITSLVKNMRAINKKISGMAKTDAVIKDNPNVSLDDLVAQRKLNQDQKAQALKKPQLQAQLATLEEQVQQYKKFDAEYQAQIQKLKEELSATHSQELEKIKQETQAQAVAHSEAELKKKLLIFSQFLQAAAAKRIAEEDPELDENKAFEGTLLLVYGGDQKAVDTALNLIEGSDEQVTSIEGTLLPVKCKCRQSYIFNTPSGSNVLSSRPTLTSHCSLPSQAGRCRARTFARRCSRRVCARNHHRRRSSCRLRSHHCTRWSDRASATSNQWCSGHI